MKDLDIYSQVFILIGLLMVLGFIVGLVKIHNDKIIRLAEIESSCVKYSPTTYFSNPDIKSLLSH